MVRAGCVKLANRRAGYLSSLSLIRACGTQRASCSARLPATAGKKRETNDMGYINPLLELPAGRELQALPVADRQRLARVLRELRTQANDEAEKAWARRTGPMAAYWRAVATYARHTAHALKG